VALTKYKQKRDFKSSPEPMGGRASSAQLRFVIQKHDASHLHYDFRLEMEGVLKSWAVPKGPSTDPSVKRLAMMVEDHPYDYRNFEGIIPSGYGAGTVIVWDEGTYEAADFADHDKKAQDKALRHQLHEGKLKIRLHGKKLQGEFALVKASGRGDNAWLLFKIKDSYASKNDITLEEKSVISKKTLAQVEKTSKNFYGAQRVKKADPKTKNGAALTGLAAGSSAPTQSKRSVKKKENETVNTRKDRDTVASLLKSVPRKKIYATLKPMLATLVDKPFDEPGWTYEVKWDGYRAISFLQKGKAQIKSRNDKSFNEKFYPIAKSLELWGISAILDGEIVVLNEKGISDFGALQNWRSETDGELYYYIFDILWLDGKDLTGLPLSARRQILTSQTPPAENIRISDAFEESGTKFFEAAKKIGLEGIVAKKTSGTYCPGCRSDDWLKIKANKRQEMVIGGYTKNDDSSRLFSSLLLGVYDKNELVYTGKVGTGFNEKMQADLIKQFKPLIIKKCPFLQQPDVNKPSRFRPDPPHAAAVWLSPKLVCEVSFAEMTSDGIMRHPSFEGMRVDKKASAVVLERPVETKEELKKDKPQKGAIHMKPATTTTNKTLLNPTEETQVKKINGHELKFTNLSKIYWPKQKVTKRDMLNYYYQVAKHILPYLKNRPQSMNRHPNGIDGPSFYYKDITGKAPDWVETFLYHSSADNRDRHYLVAQDEASLLYMASLGCIEMNPWHSRVEKQDNPDWCIIDLDPWKNSFDKVIEAALVTKAVLENLGITGYPKTSGSTGIHIYIPLGAKYTYDQSKEFARLVATLVHEQIPGFTSIERTVKSRNGKMYIDFLQNRPQATISSPYSLRPKPGAPVSMPLHWEELKKGLKMTDFNIFNAVERINSEGDLFKPVLGKGIDMEKAIAKFEKNKS
jgi:bifunctional non-homologous end joining protein LigD